MIVTVPRRDLLAACALSRKIGAALRVRCAPEGNALLLEAADAPGAVHLRQRVEAQIERPLPEGGVVVDCADLYKITRTWAAHTFLRLEAPDVLPEAPEPRGVLRVTAGKAHADIVLRDPDAPAAPSDPPDCDATLIGQVDATALRVALRVAGLASKDADRGVLCSTLLEPRQEIGEAGESVLRAVASDGHCLAYAHAQWAPAPAIDAAGASCGWPLSPVAAVALSALCASGGGVSLRGDPAGAVLQCTTDSGAVLTLDATRGDGTGDAYIDYAQVVPSIAYTPARVTVQRALLLAAAKACAAFAEGMKGACARLEADPGAVARTRSRTGSVGAVGSGIRVRLNRDTAQEHLEDPIAAELNDWPDGSRIGCNPHLLAALLEITALDAVTLHFADALSPIVWQLDGQGGVAVLMPMRLE